MLVRRTTRAPFAAGALLPGALRRSLLTLGVVVPVVLASGCTSNPEPPPLADPPPSSPVSAESPTPSPTPPSAPVMPDAAHGTSPKAAKAFVRYWVHLLNFAGSTGDTSTLGDASAPQCTACQGVIHSIDRVYRHGGYYKGNGWSVEMLRLEPFQPKLKPVITGAIKIAPQTVVKEAGGTPRTFDGGKRSMIFRLVRTDGAWLVGEIEQTKQ